MSLEDELSPILARLDLAPASRTLLLERFAQTLDLARHGEERIGLENLCDNLHDFNVLLSREARDRLALLCRKHGVAGARIGLLDTLTKPKNRTTDG